MRIILLSLIYLFFIHAAVAQTALSVEVSLKDGSTVKGKVLEYKRDEYIILEIGAGRNLKFLTNEILLVKQDINLPAQKEWSESGAKINGELTGPSRKWSFGINHLTGIGVGKDNTKLLNLSPSVMTHFSVSPLLQIGFSLGYSYIQSSDKRIILRSGSYYAYPNGNDYLSVGVVNAVDLQTVYSPKSTAYELINGQISLRINHSYRNKPVRLFSELGFGFGYSPVKDLDLAMESEIETGSFYGYNPSTGLNYTYYSYQFFSNFRSRYTNAFLVEFGSGLKFKTIKKQHLELKLSYQNTRGNINYTYTWPYAKSIEGKIPSNFNAKVIELKDRDFLNLSFIALTLIYCL